MPAQRGETLIRACGNGCGDRTRRRLRCIGDGDGLRTPHLCSRQGGCRCHRGDRMFIRTDVESGAKHRRRYCAGPAGRGRNDGPRVCAVLSGNRSFSAGHTGNEPQQPPLRRTPDKRPWGTVYVQILSGTNGAYYPGQTLPVNFPRDQSGKCRTQRGRFYGCHRHTRRTLCKRDPQRMEPGKKRGRRPDNGKIGNRPIGPLLHGGHSNR